MRRGVGCACTGDARCAGNAASSIDWRSHSELTAMSSSPRAAMVQAASTSVTIKSQVMGMMMKSTWPAIPCGGPAYLCHRRTLA
jgi:hypothetical protein